MLTVRKAISEDAEAACAAVRRSIVECCHEDHAGNPAILEAWLANKTPDGVRAWIRSPAYTAVAERDGTIVGAALLRPNGELALCYLLPEARHLGIGKSMLLHLEEEARRRGHTSIRLGTTKTAHAFYRRNGFADTGEVESMFGLTASIMSKNLAVTDRCQPSTQALPAERP